MIIDKKSDKLILHFHPLALEVLKVSLLNFSASTIKSRTLSTSEYEEKDTDQELLNAEYEEWNAELHNKVREWLPEISKNKWTINQEEAETFLRILNFTRLMVVENGGLEKRELETGIADASKLRALSEYHFLTVVQQGVMEAIQE